MRARRRASSAGLQLSTAPPRHHPVLCLGARATFALAREGACEPRRLHPQSFPQGPQARWAPRARPGPSSERDASYWGLRLERGGPTEGCGPKPARARRAPSSLSAWAAAASTPGAPRGVRLRAAPATRIPSFQSRLAEAEPAEGHRNPEPNLRAPLLAAPNPSARTQLVPEKPKTSSEASAATTPRERAPSPAPSAPHPGRINLTPRALGGKSLGVTCRWRMKPLKRTLPPPPPHVALTHISSSLECEIKACAPR